MRSKNLIQTISELEFDETLMGCALGNTSPDYLRLSPNGRYIVIGNSGRYYMFDTRHPDNSWKEGPVKESLLMVSPTDTGACWIERDGDILFVDADGHVSPNSMIYKFGRLWGNDDWLLLDSSGKLFYTTPPNFVLLSQKHHLTILHTWKLGNTLRLLSISENKKRLFLHAWNIETDDYQLLTTTRYKHDFGINGVNVIYGTMNHVHAIPETDGSVNIKMMPWAVTVSLEGEITISDNHVAWTPIIDGAVDKNNAIKRQKLAEITANILEGRLDPCAGFGSTPYLITTLQTSKSIDVITSMGHKRISINQIDQLSEEGLDQSLDDTDIATMILANCETILPQTENMASSIGNMLESDSFRENYKHLLQKKEKQIVQIAEKCFSEQIAEFALKLGTDEGEALDALSDNGLKNLAKHKMFARTFFKALDSPEVNPNARHVVKSAICSLVPFFPKKVVAIIPEKLTEEPESILDIIWRANPDAAAFFIGKAPKKEFDAKTLAKLLHHFCVNKEGRKKLAEKDGIPNLFCRNTDVLDKLFKKIYLLNKTENILKSPELLQALEAILFENGTPIPQALIRMIKYNVPIPNISADPQIALIHALSDPQISFDQIAFVLARTYFLRNHLTS